MNSIGVYKILNIVNNKFYIGSSSKSIENRWNIHRWHLRLNNHHNSKLQNSWNKYGEQVFEFSILELCLKENCIEREQYFIDSLKPKLNIRKKAESQIGLKRSKESLLRMSKAKKGQKYSEQARINMSLSRKGKKHTKQWNINIGLGQKGKIINLKTRLAVADSNRKRVWTDEARKKISISSSKQKLSKEHIEAIRKSRLNYWDNKRNLII